jgi:signal transduction histidine kinase
MNIVGNAIKYTMKGYILVDLKLDTDYLNIQRGVTWRRIVISVRDTGVGISEQNIKKLFKLFTLVQSTSKVNQQGVGLGLAICKSIIEKF